ncbi:MAG: GNAT family N-acetyltransferase [Cyanobacteriota bacterium]
MIIRKFKDSDLDSVWEIFQKVIKTGDTYVFYPDTPKKDLNKHWLAPYMNTYVVEENGEILGTYIIKPNQIDLGSHIANASYMVNLDKQGRGIGKLMCEHSLNEAKNNGYKAMQFNIVVSTNDSAVNLWKKFGFNIIGTIPDAFNHLTLGYVDAYIMYKKL